MPVRHRELGDELAAPQPKRCKHCDESRSSCGGGGSEGTEGRASWRVTLDHDLVETLSAIYPEWFKPGRAASPASPRTPHTPHTPHTPATPQTPPSDDTFSSGAEEMAGRSAGGSGASEPPSSPRVSPPKVVVDDSPLQPAMGKHKESLKVKLMMRRPINQLVAQGIMPPLKTPPAYFGQCKQLVRAKTVDLLNAKLQQRPDRQELERRHILEQESHVDPSLAEKQRMLKKARLADQLNDQLSHRPGPLELIKKNILHTEEDIETAVKSGVLAFKATSEGASARPHHPSSYCGPSDEAFTFQVSPSPSPPSTLSPPSVASPPQHPAPGKDKNRKKSKQKQQPKARFKFHEYKGPPSAQKASSPPDSTETPYELLLQQQQLLLQLMLPPSPASVASVASVASDGSDAHPPPPPPPPPAPLARFEDMKVSDLRAECKRRNLRVSGPKPQLLDRLRPFLSPLDKPDDAPRSPASVASSAPSIASVASPDPKIEEPEDIVQSQRRQIEELERKLEASRQQLESVRREAAGAAASDQSRRLIQAYVCVSQLRAQLDALQQPAAAPALLPAPAPAPPPALAPALAPAAAPRYVLAAAAAPPAERAPGAERLVRLLTVSPPAAEPADAAPAANPAYILNGVKVVPIAILPTHYEPERAPPPPPPPPPAPPAPAPLLEPDEDSRIMDDVLEILVENGELPASAVAGEYRAEEAGGADELQRELDDIQHELLAGAGERAAEGDLMAPIDFHFPPHAHDDFFRSLLAQRPEPAAMDEDPPAEPLDAPRPPFDDMEDLSLPEFHNDDSRHGVFETFADRPCDFDIKELVPELAPPMSVDTDGYDYMDTEIIPNHFGRGHVAPCDPLLGGVLARPAPRPARKHYSWDKIEFDAT